MFKIVEFINIWTIIYLFFELWSGSGCEYIHVWEYYQGNNNIIIVY